MVRCTEFIFVHVNIGVAWKGSQNPGIFESRKVAPTIPFLGIENRLNFFHNC